MLSMFNPLDIFTTKRSAWALFLAVMILCAQPAEAEFRAHGELLQVGGRPHSGFQFGLQQGLQFQKPRREWLLVVEHIGSASPPRLSLEYSGDARSRFSIDFALATDPFNDTGLSSLTEFVWRF